MTWAEYDQRMRGGILECTPDDDMDDVFDWARSKRFPPGLTGNMIFKHTMTAFPGMKIVGPGSAQMETS